MDFRKVNIDKFDPDSIVNHVPEVDASGITFEDVDRIASEVKAALQSGNGPAALEAVVERPPYGSDDSVKEAALAVAIQVFSSMRVSEIDSAVKGLDRDGRDVLIKYSYKAMGSPVGRSHGTILLNWMERSLAIAGQAAIIQHITDRRRV